MTQRDEQLDILSAYLDGEVTDAERAEVESLLQRDPDARRLLEELRQTSALLGALPQATPPSDMSAVVVARIERDALLGDESSAPRGWTLGNWTALAASIVLVAAAGWFILPQAAKLGPEGNVAIATRTDGAAEVERIARPMSSVGSRPITEERVATRGEPTPEHSFSGVTSTARPTPASVAKNFLELKDSALVAAHDKDAGGYVANATPLDQLRCVNASEAADVDRSLNEGNLTPKGLNDAAEEAFTNCILVELPDDSAVPLVCKTVEENLARNAVQNIDNEPKDKPLDRSQWFYSNRDISPREFAEGGVSGGAALVEGVRSQADEESINTSVRQIAFNVPKRQVADLVAEVQATCVSNNLEANYEVNGFAFDNAGEPEIAVDNLVTVVDDIQVREALETALADGSWGDDDEEEADEAHGAIRARTKEAATPKPARNAEADDEPKRRVSADDRGRAKPGFGKPKSRGGGGGASMAKRERTGDGFVGPPLPEAEDDTELVTCVVIIRPMTQRERTRDPESTMPTKEGWKRAGRFPKPKPTQPPASSQPVGGQRRG